MKEIINKGFYCSLRNFVIASTNFLQKVEVSGARRPTKEVYLLKLKEDSFSESGHSVSWGHSKIRSSEPDLRQFGMIYYEEIRKLKEVRECINLSIQINEIRNELSKERGVDSALNKIFEESILKRLLMEYLWEANSLQFNEEVFVDIYKKLEDYFYKKEFLHKALSPLHYLHGDIEKIDFEGVKIIKLSNGEIMNLYKKFGESIGDLIISSKYFLEGTYITDKSYVNTTGVDQLRQIFNDVVIALRLFKHGAIGTTRIFTIPQCWREGISNVSSELEGCIGGFYKLERSEIPKFMNHWECIKRRLRTIKMGSPINLALRRFTDGYRRRSREDKLIDYMIAFEALFLKEGEQQELRYKLSLRTAYLLDGEARRKVFDVMNEAYNLRSKIVHGSALKPKFKSKIPELIQGVEDYLREAIKSYLTMPHTSKVDKIIELIDDTILKGWSEDVHKKTTPMPIPAP